MLIGWVIRIAAVITAVLGATSAWSQEPIRIGVMYPLTGGSATQGLAVRDAIKMAFDQERNTIAGRKIELLMEDSAGRADTGLTKVKALVERDKVNLLLTEFHSTVGAAIAPYITEAKIPWVNNVSLASLTRNLKSPYIFRFVPSSYQFAKPVADKIKALGWKKVYFVGWNAPPSREAFEVLKKVLGEERIAGSVFPNIGTADYAPYLTTIASSGADGVVSAVWGADAQRLVQQYSDYGLDKQLPLFGMGSFTSALTHTDDTVSSLSFATISLADFVQTKGRGSAFWRLI